MRIGIYRRWFEDVTHPEIAQVCYKMLDSLIKDHGAVLVDIEIPELFENGKAHNITIVGEMLSKISVRFMSYCTMVLHASICCGVHEQTDFYLVIHPNISSSPLYRFPFPSDPSSIPVLLLSMNGID